MIKVSILDGEVVPVDVGQNRPVDVGVDAATLLVESMDFNVSKSTNKDVSFDRTIRNTGETITETVPQPQIHGTRDRAIVCDVSNYYVNNARVVAKYWEPTRADGADSFDDEREQKCFGIKNEAGTILIPYGNGAQMESSGNPLGGILCMASFLKQGIQYGNGTEAGADGYSIFDVSAEDEENPTYNRMVCSDYVATGLRGISYNNSRASGCGENFESQYKSRTALNIRSLLSPNNKEALITRELAYTFAVNGALFELDYKRLSNVSTGDVLFFATSSTSASTQGVASNYLGIAHCSMVVDVDTSTGLVCVLECGQATTTALWNYSLTEDSETTRGPCYNVYRIIDDDGHSTLASTRRIYVGKPAWPNIDPTHVSSTTITDAQTTTGEDYTNAWFTLQKSVAGFKKGDLVIARLTSNLNDINPYGLTPAEGGHDYVLRIDGAHNNEDDAVITKTLWRTFTRSSRRHIVNDRVMLFFVDDDVYTRIRIMVRTPGQAVDLTGTCTFDVYRL